MSREERPPARRTAAQQAAAEAWLWERTRWPVDRLSQGLLQAVRDRLARSRPAQVEPSATLSFGSEHGHVAVLPHRDLPLALVLRLRGREAELGWAWLRSGVPAADVAHLVAARGPVTLAHPDAGLEELLRALEEELARPLELRVVWVEGEPVPLAVEVWVGGARLLRRARFSLRALLRVGRLHATARALSLGDPERAPVTMHGREGWAPREPDWGGLRPPAPEA